MELKYILILCVVLGLTLSVQSVFADSPSVDISITGGVDDYYVTGDTNSTDLWDSLDTPADINLTDLGDVDEAAPEDDELLSWDASATQWVARAVAGITDTDTNATTECSTDEVLDGDGDCVSFYNFTATEYFYNMTAALDLYNYTDTDLFYNMSDTLWFYNQTHTADLYNYTATDLFYNMSDTLWFYNQTVLDTTIADTDTNYSTACSSGEYGDGSGACISFNDTVSDIIKITYYNATSIDTIAGTNETTDLTLLQIYDGNSYNISEEAGTPGLDVRINFTSVTDFNQVTLRMKTTDGGKHRYKIQIWDSGLSDWEDYSDFVEVDTYKVIDLGVYDSADHIVSNKVIVRIYLAESGNTNHYLSLDWIILSDGIATFSTNEIDPLSFHKGENLDIDFFNLTNIDKIHALDWTNATFLLAQISDSYNYTATSYFYNMTATDLFYNMSDTLWFYNQTVLDTTIADTSAYINCSTNQVYLGNGSCSAFYNMTVTADLYNYTATDLFYNMSDTLWFYNQTHTADLYNYTATDLFYNMTATDLFYNMSDTLWFYNQTHTADLYNYTATSLFYNMSTGYVADTGDSITGSVNMTDNNITSVDCIYFTSGGSWCSA